MLKPQKKKLSKKDLKKDPLLDSVMKAQTFYESNKNTISYGITGLVLVILLFIWINALNVENAEKGRTLLGKAQVEMDYYNTGKAKGFLTKLQVEYSGSDAAIQGAFLLANINFDEQNYTEAKILFEEFVSSFSGSNIILSSGYAGLAACYEMENDYINAATQYEKAYSEAGNLNQAAEYLYFAGLNYYTVNDLSKATEIFQNIVDNYSDSPKTYDAQTKLIMASMK